MVADVICPPLSFRNVTGKDHIWRSVISWHLGNYDVIAAGERGGRISR